MHSVIFKYLKYLNLNVSKNYFEELVVSNANFPSLLSISDVLERLSIRHDIGQVNKESLRNLEFPYVLHIDKKEGDLVFVKNEKDLDRNEQKLKNWSGTVIKIYSKEIVNNKTNEELIKEENFTKHTLICLLISIGIIVFFAGISDISWSMGLLSLTAAVGITIGYFLVAKDVGIEYDSIKSFCYSVKRKKSGCDAMLNSNKVNFLGNITFSDLTITYFSFQIVVLGLSNHFSSFYSILAIISYILIPIVVFSLYYQYFKVKAWCQLCLIVDAILIIQALIITYQSIRGLYIEDVQFIKIIFSISLFTTILGSTILVKKAQKTIIRVKTEKFTYKRVVQSVSVFLHLLLGQRMVRATPIQGEIALGNSIAPIKIIMVSNLYCNPCKLQHKIIDELLMAYPEKIQVSIRFLQSNEENGRITPSQYILGYWLKNIYETSNVTDRALEMLQDWYEMMDLEKFTYLYPLKIGSLLNTVQSIEREQSLWFRESKIVKTPTIFINGHLLPEEYNLENLASLIPELSEYYENTPIQLENTIPVEV